MSEEVKITTETKEESKCLCQSKGFRKFLVIALGTFVGVYSALCLFAALHKPPIIPPSAMGYGFGAPVPFGMQCPCHMKKHHFNKHFMGEKSDFHASKKSDKLPAPFEANRQAE